MSVLLVPGDPVADDFVVRSFERRLADRKLYHVDDARSERRTRTCWDCSFQGVPRDDPTCPRCGRPVADRRFRLVVRTEADVFAAYEKLWANVGHHPDLLRPVSLFRDQGRLVSAIPTADAVLLAELPAPLSAGTIEDIRQRTVWVAQYLAGHGHHVGPITPWNVLVYPDGTCRVCDLEPSGTRMQSEDLVQDLHRLLGRCAPCEGRTRAAALTDTGAYRARNEDAWSWSGLEGGASVYVVADGMGGHVGGDIAAQAAVQVVADRVRRRFPGVLAGELRAPDLLKDAVEQANATIHELGNEGRYRMGCTVVAAVVEGDGRTSIASVGDSRVYATGDGRVRRITDDHSFVGRLVRQGTVTEDDARTHPLGHVLERALGQQQLVDVDVHELVLAEGERLLLCTDGLWGELPDGRIAALLGIEDTREACASLVRAAIEEGGKDNVTVLLADRPRAASLPEQA